MSDVLRGVRFDFIRYANCWEDAGLLLHALAEKQPARIAIVASAGDNALALLSQAPREVLAFDISLPQLYLTELKQAAFAKLDYPEIRTLLGADESIAHERVRLLDHLLPALSPSARAYWQERRSVAEKGIIHTGKFERYFALFRRFCLPLAHSRKTVQALLAPKHDEAQAAFYRRHWNTWRWRLLMSIFFSRAVMGRAGRDPQFLKQVKLSVPQYIRQQAAAHLQSSHATTNPFLHYIFTGNFGAVRMHHGRDSMHRVSTPHYLHPELYDSIRTNIGRLTLRQATADDIAAMQAHDAYCLSNIFEYMPQSGLEDTAQRWQELLPTGAMLLFWNLMVPRSFASSAPDAFERVILTDPPPDAGFFYSDFLVEQRR